MSELLNDPPNVKISSSASGAMNSEDAAAAQHREGSCFFGGELMRFGEFKPEKDKEDCQLTTSFRPLHLFFTNGLVPSHRQLRAKGLIKLSG